MLEPEQQMIIIYRFLKRLSHDIRVGSLLALVATAELGYGRVQFRSERIPVLRATPACFCRRRRSLSVRSAKA
jgi:hypothetical protein